MAHEPGFAKGLSIGIIMDGNGRWAKKRGLPRTAGHTRGAEVFRDIIRYCNELEVACVTFYAFSTENWSRPMEEVNGIMKLFGEYLIMAYDYQKENNRVVFLGDRTALPAKYQAQMNDIEEKTRGNTGTVLNVAVNYGGRQEIVRGMQILARRVQQGLLRPEDIDIETVSGVMYTAGQKDPDFILRPSGEHRLSNFMLWQASYAEFVDMDVLWPDFTRTDLDRAIEEYNTRSRRFGGIFAPRRPLRQGNAGKGGGVSREPGHPLYHGKFCPAGIRSGNCPGRVCFRLAFELSVPAEPGLLHQAIRHAIAHGSGPAAAFQRAHGAGGRQFGRAAGCRLFFQAIQARGGRFPGEPFRRGWAQCVGMAAGWSTCR